MICEAQHRDCVQGCVPSIDPLPKKMFSSFARTFWSPPPFCAQDGGPSDTACAWLFLKCRDDILYCVLFLCALSAAIVNPMWMWKMNFNFQFRLFKTVLYDFDDNVLSDTRLTNHPTDNKQINRAEHLTVLGTSTSNIFTFLSLQTRKFYLILNFKSISRETILSDFWSQKLAQIEAISCSKEMCQSCVCNMQTTLTSVVCLFVIFHILHWGLIWYACSFELLWCKAII